MNFEDPGKRSVLQVRASRLVKRLGALGVRRLPSPSPATRASLDLPRKPFVSPSQPALSHFIRDTVSDRSSDDSIPSNSLGENASKKDLWDKRKHSTPKSYTLPSPHHSPREPLDIVSTQHLSPPSSNVQPQRKKGGAISHAGASIAAQASGRVVAPSAARPGAVLNAPGISITQGNLEHREAFLDTPSSYHDFLRPTNNLTSPPEPLSRERTDIVSYQYNFVSQSNSNSPLRSHGADRPDLKSAPPNRTPRIRPWTPPAFATSTGDLDAAPSGAISPMTLGSPAVTPLSISATSASSLLVPHEASRTRRSPSPRLRDPLPPTVFPTHPLFGHRKFVDKEGHSLRLSPAIIQRVPPWPIKQLPSIPLTIADSDMRVPRPPRIVALRESARGVSVTPTSGERRPGPSRLSSMPTLHMSEGVRPQVRENQSAGRVADVDVQRPTPGDSPEPELAHEMDEDEMDEPGDYLGPRPSTSLDDHPQRSQLSMNRIAEVDRVTEPEPINRLGEVDQTPFGLEVLGWDIDMDTLSFNATPLSISTSSSPESGSSSSEPQSGKRCPGMGNIPLDNLASRRVVPLSEGMESPRHHASRSMVDLRFTLPPTPSGPAERRKSVARRQSMPSMTELPPRYMPRMNEEGSEGLPGYSNTIFRIGQMPRKMEFTQPGVLSRDRKWRRVWCVLEGTKFSVYRVRDVRSVWEGVVGAGNGTVQRKGKERAMEEGEEEEKVRKVEGETRGVSRASPSTSTFLATPGSPQFSRSPSPSNISSRSSESVRTLRTHRSHSRSSPPPVPERPDPSLLLREYTLQHAESGLGSDYTKRQNVIRLRMEGEQFLLQAKDVEDVVEWIEGFQAASDIALDLDERKMPRGPLFPRRRRRRRPRSATEDGNIPASLTAALATNSS